MTPQNTASAIVKTEKSTVPFRVQDFEVGMVFKIKVSHYAKETFTVEQICDGLVLCAETNGRGRPSFDNDNLNYYGDKVQILSRPKFNTDKLIEAQTQLVATKVLLCDEAEGARWIKATEKAFTEILENETIQFDGEVVGFVSRTSGKTRFVTKSGCDFSCDCGGQISYHTAIFEILSRYHKLSNVRQFPSQNKAENQDLRMVA
jgi:hypothetical protein